MKKYAYANVKIPLEVLSNGNFELLKEHIQVEFTHCKELPPKQELNIDFSSILNDLFTQDKITPPIKNNETNSHFSNGLAADKNNFEHDNGAKFLSSRCNINQENEGNEREIKIKNMVEEPEPQNELENEQQKQPQQNTEKQQEVEKMIILSSEIKKNKNMNKNLSFKNRKNSHNFTNKSRY